MKIYMFTFESIYTKKIGGLAEVPPRLGEAISSKGYEVVVVTPNHGLIDTCREAIYSTRINSVEYCISRLPHVKPIHLVIGGGILDDPEVYPMGRLMDKSITFAQVISRYFSEVFEKTRDQEIVFHGHDWHSIPTLLALNKLSVDRGVKTSLVYHVHLLSRNAIREDSLCRSLDICRDSLLRGDLGIRAFREYYERSRGLIERLVSLTVDKVITVSKGYTSSLVRNIGIDTAWKIDYVYNASPLTWSDVTSILEKKTGLRNPIDPQTRLEFRKLLLTERIKTMSATWTERDVGEYIKKLLDHYGVVYNRPFSKNGPLVFSIGRLSRQKGLDLVVRAMDRFTAEIPDVKVIITPAPSKWNLNEVKGFIETTLSYPDNLRVIPGFLSREETVEFYYASNVTLIPSRNEPFGLVALESMATGTPVSASRVGGLVDIVVDIRHHPSSGVGVLFEKSDIEDMVKSTSYLVNLIEEGYRGRAESIHVRNTCIKRVSEFNWSTSAEKTINIYREIMG